MSLQQYSSQRIANSSQIQLQALLNKFKSEHISIGKFGIFVAYNFVALAGLLGFTSWYVKSRWIKGDMKRKISKKQLSISKVMKKGSMIGLLVGGIYVIGFLAVGYYTMPIPVFKKYCQLQESLHSFQIKYDPFYQQILLYRKMKKFGLSDSLISEIKVDLNKKKQYLISNNMLKPETVESLKKAQQMYSKTWKVQLIK